MTNTNAYNKMDRLSQSVVSKHQNRKRIKSSVIIAKNIGYEKWLQMTDLPYSWRNIVKELVA